MLGNCKNLRVALNIDIGPRVSVLQTWTLQNCQVMHIFCRTQLNLPSPLPMPLYSHKSTVIEIDLCQHDVSLTGAGCGGATHNGWHISLLHCTCPTLYTEPGESLLMPAAQCTFTSCWWFEIVSFTSLLVLNLIQGTRECFSPYSLKPEGGTQYCGLDNSKKINQLIYSSYFVQYFSIMQ